jgi:YMGG-like Gly-zipper
MACRFHITACKQIPLIVKKEIMKKALLFVSILSIFFAVACTTQTKQEAAVPTVPAFDTTGLAAFQEWQFENEQKNASEYMVDQPVAKAPVKTVKKKVTPRKATPAPVVTEPEAPVQEEQGTVNETPSTNESGTIGTETTNEAKKKGISNTVKGTVIGAVSGAVLGAVINKKNRVVGGVLGGVLGGGVGFGIGKKIDKNQGR